MAGVGGIGAVALAQDGGAPVVAGAGQHISYASAEAQADAAPLRPGAMETAAQSPIVGTGASGALVINPTFDSSITGDPNSAAIQAMINDAIAVYESLYNDPITVAIRFRYATTLPDGSPMPGGALAISTSVVYSVPWSTYIVSLTADATTVNDATANASLPGSPLSTNMLPSSADGRALSLSTPPAMFADGSLGVGGPYDGIVTLNSAVSFKFTRPPAAGKFDALRTTEHEMDEVLGLGSFIGLSSDLRPQDLFSWSAPGTRNLTSSGSRYFSIDGGTTNLVGFNQNPSGDFGDWLSGSCPQATPYVQNAFGCANQASDVTTTSPEGINLDVVGYDLIVSATTTTTTATSTTSTTAPPGEDSGFIPPDAATRKCEDGVAKALAKYMPAVVKCHVASADSGVKGVPLDDELCESNPSTGKGAKEKYDAAIGKLVTKGCGGCAITNAPGLQAAAESFLDGNNGQPYCAGSTPFLGGDDSGSVPPDAATKKCEDGVAKALGSYIAKVLGCHVKSAALGVKALPHDDELCESNPSTGKGAKEKYDAAIGKLVTKGCGGCAITNAPGLRAAAESFLDGNNGQPYCAGSVPF